MRKAKIKHWPPKSWLGFSLLELLVVISLLSVVALAATSLIIDTGEEKRKDATEKNWDAIRKAIIGDSTQSLNGSPYLSGYVADMGRLPNNIKELMSQGSQTAWSELNIDPSGTVTGLSGALHAGWRGPYLYTAGSAEFRDGWRNEDLDLAEDSVNFGWSVTLDSASPTHTAIYLQSLGESNQVGGVEYGEDFPSGSGTLIDANDWQANVSSVTFDLRFTALTTPVLPTPNPKLELRLYFVDDVSIDDSETMQFDYLGASATSHSQQEVMPIAGGSLPMGKYAAVILCTNGVSPTATATGVYDGDCSGGLITKKPYYFTVLPSTRQVTIPWNTP